MSSSVNLSLVSSGEFSLKVEQNELSDEHRDTLSHVVDLKPELLDQIVVSSGEFADEPDCGQKVRVPWF